MSNAMTPQDHRAAKASQHTDFAGSEAVIGVIRVPSREVIGKCRDAQGHRMGSHVPAICQQGHGAKQIARGNLDNHHRKGQHNNPASIAFSVPVFNIIMVAVFPFLQRVYMHNDSLP